LGKHCYYSMLIRWSDEDQAFFVSLPEFGPCANTHGATYDEAVRMGQEALELLIESYQALGNPLAEPAKYEALAHTSGRMTQRQAN
jgi:predicted RNase H-like HicB family nuclease